MDTIIDALTYRIGRQTRKTVRQNYHRWLGVIRAGDEYVQSSDEIRLFLDDILGLSVFYQYVIVPLYGASDFYGTSQRRGISGIRMAGVTLSSEDFETMDKIAKHFFAISKKYQIDVDQLAFATRHEFLERWTGFYVKHGNR